MSAEQLSHHTTSAERYFGVPVWAKPKKTKLMNLFRINTTAFHEEDFTLYTDLNNEQILAIITRIVKDERDGFEGYDNDDLVSALKNAYPNNFISQRYNEPEMISI